MESESLELSSKSGASSAQSFFIFDRNSVINATLYSGGSPSYTIITSKSGTRTDVCDIPGKCVVATIKRREILADTIKFTNRNDGKAVAINKWLRPTVVPSHVEPCTSLVTDVGYFVWKTDAAHRLALYSEDDAQVPLAFMTRVRPPEPLVLVLKDGCEEMVEDILVSFIILEQRLRMKEKRRSSAMMYGPVSSGMP
ncbi:hypothetical protein BDZ97DRAFT_1669372 [Flammula alnicola]|nr:hypothetical protein BDZ97DRAFT_1669372 [Flammula alnicola]